MCPIAYSIIPLDPAAHLFQVTCRVEAPAPEGQGFRLPNWIPGSYKIRDFAQHLVAIEARDDRGPVALTKIDKCRWRAAPAHGALCLEYRVYAWDLSVRAAHLDSTHAYFNGTSVFLLAEGFETHPCDLSIVAPQDPACSGWRVVTSMSAGALDAAGFGSYRANDYIDLIDHPVEMGAFERHWFNACGVEHQLVLSGRFKADTARLGADLAKICEHHIRFFGEPAPFDRYVFLVAVVGDGGGGGGLEHKFSSSLMVSRASLPAAGESDVNDAYLEFLSLCSHEYFHAWNAKRIRPRRLVEASLDREAHTSLLWAFEGITSYYDDLALVRCGLIEPQRYLALLEKTITRVAQTPGRRVQTLGDASFDAWTKFYQQDENAPNATVSYYAKGALVALALDLRLRQASGGTRSLDHLMRALWRRHGQSAETGTVGVDEMDIESLAEEIAGVPLKDFFDRAIRGVDDLPLQALLPQVGVRLEWGKSHAEIHRDAAGETIGSTALSQGLRLDFDGGLAQITHVLAESAAQRAGLAAGDALLAIDGLRILKNNLGDMLRRYRIGEQVVVNAFRRDQLMTFTLRLAAAPRDTAVLSFVDRSDCAPLGTWLDSGDN